MSKTPEAWTPHIRALKKRAIDNEAARAAARLGAKCVVMIVMFSDGKRLHIQDGGSAPMPYKELYKRILSAHDHIDDGHEGFLS